MPNSVSYVESIWFTCYKASYGILSIYGFVKVRDCDAERGRDGSSVRVVGGREPHSVGPG
jgi:hypothetical protein